MNFIGLRKEQDWVDLIACLKRATQYAERRSRASDSLPEQLIQHRAQFAITFRSRVIRGRLAAQDVFHETTRAGV